MIIELSRKEWDLEDRLRNAQKQVRIVEGLVHVYGAMKKVRDEAHQRKAAAQELEAELAAVRRELDELESRDMAGTKDEKDDDAVEFGEAHEEPPPPRLGLRSHS